MAVANVPVIDIVVSFGGVSIGEKTARLGVNCDREVLDIDRADEAFCDRRLSGSVVLGHTADAPGQAVLFDDTDHVVRGVFDVKGFRVSSAKIGTGLTFSLNDIDVAELAKFSSGTGRLLVDEIADIPEDEEKAIAQHVPGTLRSEGPWRDVSLDTLFDPKQVIRKSLAAANINTVGELADYTASDQRLTDIEGIGETKAAAIEDRMVDFFADNPNAE